MNSYGVKE